MRLTVPSLDRPVRAARWWYLIMKRDDSVADCIVIGGGVIGMLSAHELSRSGVAVTLLERGECGREASWAGGGILSPLYPWHYPAAVNALAAWSQARYRDLAEELGQVSGIDPEWTRSGMLILDADTLAAKAWAARCGVQAEAWRDAAIIGCEPALAEGIVSSAVWLPDVAQVRNPRLMKALRASLLAQGVKIREHVEVRGLQVRNDRVVGVEAGAGRITAERVVVTAGAWSSELFTRLGVGLEVAPVRGQMILFLARPGLLKRIVLYGNQYLIPRRDGHILAGSTLEYVGFDKSTTVEALADLRRAALELVPELARVELAAQWAGLRPGSPTGVPFIGEHPRIRGLFVNAGHFRNGLVLAPASARLLADLMLGRVPILNPRPYGLADHA